MYSCGIKTVDLITVYAQFDMVNAIEVQSSVIFSACVNEALEGPLCQFCTHLFVSLHVVCFIKSCRIQFLHFNYLYIAERVGLFEQGQKLCYLIIHMLQEWFRLLIQYQIDVHFLFHAELLRTVIHCKCLPVKEINV